MWTGTTLCHPIGTMVFPAALALLCLDTARAQETQFTRPGAVLPASRSAQLLMRESGSRIQRVDFVLDQASQPRAEESEKTQSGATRRRGEGKAPPEGCFGNGGSCSKPVTASGQCAHGSVDGLRGGSPGRTTCVPANCNRADCNQAGNGVAATSAHTAAGIRAAADASQYKSASAGGFCRSRRSARGRCGASCATYSRPIAGVVAGLDDATNQYGRRSQAVGQ